MKFFRSIIILSSLFFFSQCKTVDLRFKLYNQPLVKLPQNVKQIAVVNRTILDSTKKDKNIVEAVLSGEAILGDKLGAEDCIFSFTRYINNYGPVTAIVPDAHKLRGGIGFFNTDPLDWKLVSKICRENKSDALMALEKFDTNSDAAINAMVTGANILNGGTGTKDIRYNIVYGFILYDTLTRSIIYYNDQSINEVARGLPMLSPLPTSAVKNTAIFIGEREAGKFNSTWYWVHREYYKKPKDPDFSIGYRRAVVNDWDGAIDMWLKCAQSSSRKTAGRACYNIAIAYEVKGNLQEAFKWAQKSYSDYGTKLAKNYVYVLQRRINNGN